MAVLSLATAAIFAGAPAIHAAAAVNFAAEAPTLAAKTQHANQYIFFPQTLQRVSFLTHDTLLLSYQSGADKLHDDGWTGGLLGSTDQGTTWHAVPQPLSPMLVKSCFEPGEDELKCYEYPLCKLAPNSSDDTHAQLGWQHFTASATAPGGFVQDTVGQATVTFPADKRLKSWGDSTFKMVTDGKIIHLQPNPGQHREELLLLLYGQFTNTSKYTLVAVHTADVQAPGGAAWTYLSEVSRGAPAPCDNPSEHDCEWLGDFKTLMCIWRSDGTASTLCESRSSDNGRTWTSAQPLSRHSGGGRGREENANANPIPSAPIGVEPKLGRLNNGLLVVSGGRPGLYLWVAADPTLNGGGGGGPNATAPLAWEGFNLAAHHNAAVTDPSLRYSSDTPGGSETTSYTGMVVTPDLNGDAVVVSYDRLANGWSPAPYPPGGQGLSALFTVRITITKVAPVTASTAPPAGLYGMTGSASGPPGNAQLVLFDAEGTRTPLGSKNTEFLNGFDAATLNARTGTFFQNSQAARPPQNPTIVGYSLVSGAVTSTLQLGFWDEIFVAAGEAMAWADDLDSLIVAGQAENMSYSVFVHNPASNGTRLVATVDYPWFGDLFSVPSAYCGGSLFFQVGNENDRKIYTFIVDIASGSVSHVKGDGAVLVDTLHCDAATTPHRLVGLATLTASNATAVIAADLADFTITQLGLLPAGLFPLESDISTWDPSTRSIWWLSSNAPFHSPLATNVSLTVTALDGSTLSQSTSPLCTDKGLSCPMGLVYYNAPPAPAQTGGVGPAEM